MERLDEFLAGLPEQSPEEFLAQEQVEGLAAFQDDVAGIIAETTDQRSTLCNLDGLQTLIAERLTEVEPDGVLQTFLVNTVLRGGELETADVRVRPGDDVEAVLALLDDGSSITFAAGTYDFVRPLIVQRDVAIVGQGQDDTILRSSAADAAIVVVGRGLLRTRDLTVEHMGIEQASVVVAFGRPVDLDATTLRGGLSDSEGAGGNALVLTDEVFGGGDFDATQPDSVISATELSGNEGAGLVVDGALAPAVIGASITDNDICGICLFGAATGVIEDSVIERNSFGIQVGDQAAMTVRGNSVSANTVAGIVVVGEASVVVDTNQVFGNVEAGIVVQEAASASVRGNTVSEQPFGLSILASGVVEVEENVVEGAEVGIQVDETSAPTVRSNTVRGTTAVGIAHAGNSTGTFVANVVEPISGVGVLTEAVATPVVEGLTVRGGEVAFAATGSSAAVLADAQFTGQEIGAQTDEMSSPTLTDIVIREVADAGLVFRGSSTPAVERVEISDFGEVAIAVADEAAATVVDATVRRGRNGASLIGSGTTQLANSSFGEVEVGVQVGESATPILEDNEVVEPASVGFVFIDQAGGEMRRNRVTDPGLVGVQLGGDAAPNVEENVFFFTRPEGAEPLAPALASDDPVGDASDVEEVVPEGGDGDAVVGLLYAENAAGTTRANQVVGFVIGFQVGDRATPELVDNDVDGGVWLGVGFLYRDDAAGSATGNSTANHGVGFQLSDRSTPEVSSNVVTRIRDVAFLVQGAANPILEKNICPDGVAGIGVLDDTSPTLIDNECVEVSG